MRTKLSFYNASSAILLQIVNMLVALTLPNIIITEYGSAVNGLVNSIRQFIQYLSVVEGGLAFAAIYALYKPLAEKDQKSINGILAGSDRLYNKSGLLLSILIVVGAFLYPVFTDGEGISPLTMALLVIIIGTQGALEFFAIGKYKVLLTADQKSYVISIINAFASILNAAIIIILVKMHINIVLVWLFALTSFIVRAALYALYSRKRYSELSFNAEPNMKALDKRWDSLILQILGAVTTGTPILIITFVCGLKESSVYTVYNMVFVGVMSILSTFNNGLSAVFGDMLAKKETEPFQRAYKQYEFIYYALLGWAYSCAAILIMPFIGIYTQAFTDVVYYRPLVAALFVLNGVLYNTKTPQGMLVLSAGLYKETKIQTLIQAIINIAVSLALAPSLGIVGVLIGSVIANIYRTIDLAIFIPRVLTKLPVRMTVFRMIRMFVLMAISILPIKWVTINATSYVEWVIWAVLVAIWCFIVFALGNIIIEKHTTKDVLERLKYSFVRRKKSNV